MKNKNTKMFGMAAQADLPQIDCFNTLFELYPDCQFIIPNRYEKQIVSREVIRKGHRNHHIGYFASRINKAMVPYESSLEKQACMLFESYSEVQAYRSQPYRVTLYYGGELKHVYPDFELETRTQKVLIDVHYEQSANKQRYRVRCGALQEFAELRGMHYALLTEKEIKTQRLTNSSWLLSLCHGRPDERLLDAVWEWLIDCSVNSYGDIFDITVAYPSVRSALAALTLDGHILIDWNKPLHTQHFDLRRGDKN